MGEFVCRKCGSVDLYIKENGTQVGLYCSDCGAWQKWLGKDERRIAEKWIEEHKQTPKEKDDGTLLAQYQALGTPAELAELVKARDEGRLVEVVRCKDCKYLTKYTTSRLWCAYYSDGEYQKEVYNDDFCSYGERWCDK